jgi:hypothetical protein
MKKSGSAAPLKRGSVALPLSVASCEARAAHSSVSCAAITPAQDNVSTTKAPPVVCSDVAA